MKISLDSFPIANLVKGEAKVVNGVDRREAVDVLMDALEASALPAEPGPVEQHEQQVHTVLSSPSFDNVLPSGSGRRPRAPQSQAPPLLYSECQGAFCTARALLTEFAQLCADGRSCSLNLQIEQPGQK